jgi:hypothetical protein
VLVHKIRILPSIDVGAPVSTTMSINGEPKVFTRLPARTLTSIGFKDEANTRILTSKGPQVRLDVVPRRSESLKNGNGSGRGEVVLRGFE